MRQINSRVAFWVIIGSIGRKFGNHLEPIKKLLSCGLYGIKWSRSTNGGLELHRLLSLNNVCYASPIRMSRLNTNFRIAFKLKGLGVGHFHYARIMWVRTGNYDSFNWKQTLFGNKIPMRFVKEIQIWHLLKGITL